jgi:septal ring factor EnvC (AmiA/AmiB activator)
MSGNSIAISRELVAAGVEQKTANAMAEAIVKHSDERNATREDLVKMEATIKEKTQDEINALRNDISNVEVKIAKLEARVDSLESKLDSFRDETRSHLRLLTVIVVIGILAPYIERAFGG